MPSFAPRLSLFLCLLVSPELSDSARSSLGYRPKGLRPLLYEPGVDSIMHLDADTFKDTVMDRSRDRAFVIEFYKDWCGDCRQFVPFFKQLAESVREWPLVQVAAINCADAYNTKICLANNITLVPDLKFFPRKLNTFLDAKKVGHPQAAIELRRELHQELLSEFSVSEVATRIIGEPKRCPESLCQHLTKKQKLPSDDLWEGVPMATENQAFVLAKKGDRESAAKLAFDLLLYKPRLEVLSIEAPNDGASNSGSSIRFPYVLLLRRGNSTPIFAEIIFDEKQTVQKIYKIIEPMLREWNRTELAEAHQKPKIPSLNCLANMELCRQLFYVSEVDILKAIRLAILDEVISSGGDWLEGENFNALREFLDLLIKRFPQTTKWAALMDQNPQQKQQLRSPSTRSRRKRPKDKVSGTVSVSGRLPIQLRTATSTEQTIPLVRSQRAVRVFRRLKDLLDQRAAEAGGRISMDDWKAVVEAAESIEDSPFPMDADWEHCKGSTPIFRGFTCGLWTAFHTLIANAFQGGEDQPLRPLKGIQRWVGSFFSCSGCRRHFMQMTTESFPLNERQVSRPMDTVLYLWKAHNKVNHRLYGDEATEDPQFPKEQFPPSFLCPNCRKPGIRRLKPGEQEDDTGEQFDESQTLQFLVQFAQQIKPHPITVENGNEIQCTMFSTIPIPESESIFYHRFRFHVATIYL